MASLLREKLGDLVSQFRERSAAAGNLAARPENTEGNKGFYLGQQGAFEAAGVWIEVILANTPEEESQP